MKILLLQSAVYLPSYGGGNKSNRLLLEALVERGHECCSISKSVNAQTVIDQTSEADLLRQRGIQPSPVETGVIEYQYRQVRVFSVNSNHKPDSTEFISQHYASIDPDILLVSDDKKGDLLVLALQLSPRQTVLIVHTNLHLPFGEEATDINPIRAKYYRQCRNILTATKYTQTYLQMEADLASTYLPFPIFGPGPFNNIARFNQGHIGMINPCAVKGIDIFIGLAEQFSQLDFLAVPTWGANATDMQRLENLCNVHIMFPTDDTEEILEQIQILIVPSLIPETFGYVVVEAMLRGIPVLASNLGGLRDAKLGVDYLLQVQAAVNLKGQHSIPDQDLAPWTQTLQELIDNSELYQQCSDNSYKAAMTYLSSVKIEAFETYFKTVLSS